MLIVDDQQSVRDVLQSLLGRAGYRTFGVESGREAIALAAIESIDGALIDVHMPVMNGFDTCLSLQSQANSFGRPLRVWFMTGAITKSLECRSADLGTFGVLGKPFDFVALTARLGIGFSSPFPPLPSVSQEAAAIASDVSVPP